jgi:AraC-like DNA-binding protein
MGKKGRLGEISDWEERAKAAGYNVEALAERCKVPVRTLRWFIHRKFGKSPHQWMTEMRQREALAILKGEARVKDASSQLHFRQMSHFSKQFSSFYGMSPRAMRAFLKPGSDANCRF